MNEEIIKSIKKHIDGMTPYLSTCGDSYYAAGYLACLNDTSDGLDVLEDVVRRELAGWA